MYTQTEGGKKSLQMFPNQLRNSIAKEQCRITTSISRIKQFVKNTPVLINCWPKCKCEMLLVFLNKFFFSLTQVFYFSIALQSNMPSLKCLPLLSQQLISVKGLIYLIYVMRGP